jgi:hypothetical protein
VGVARALRERATGGSMFVSRPGRSTTISPVALSSSQATSPASKPVLPRAAAASTMRS